MTARTERPRASRGEPRGGNGDGRRIAAPHALGAAILIALAGCGGDDDTGALSPDPGGSGPAVDGPGPEGATRSALRRLDDRDAFLAELRGALVAQRAGDDAFDGADVAVEDADFAEGAPGAEAPQVPGDADGAGVAEAGGGGEGGGADGGAAEPGELGTAAGGRRFTGTNVQEAGVDERDRVKTDGEYLFVLEPRRAGVFPPLGPVPIEGPGAPAIDPAVEPGPAVPDVDPEEDFPVGIDGTSLPAPDTGPAVLRILALDPDTPDATPVANIELGLGGRGAGGLYLYGEGADRTAVVTSSGGGAYASWGDSVVFLGLDTLVRRIDAGDPANASVGTTLLVEGQTVSSRRIGAHLFLASRFYPDVGVDPWSVDAATWEAAVAQAPDGALLPRFAIDGGEAEALIDPADCFVAPRPENARWYAPDVVTLAVIDLETLRPVDTECFLGASETLYASPDSVYLATTRWDYGVGPVDETGAAVAEEDAAVDGDVFWQDPRAETDIHRFRIDDGALDYAGSGSVPGHLGWNAERMPYRLSERDGYLRVATMNDEQGPDASPILLTVLGPGGEGDGAGPAPLERVAELPNEANPAPIGKPGEQLYASRFLGERGYLVTFRQTDPLYVLDLADPRNPRVSGELEITGYSDWLLPVGEGHVLGIGKGAVPVVDGFGDGRGALFQGVKLSLFDVSDPAAPREVQSLAVGERGTESPALADPRAITIMPGADGSPTRVAFGIDVYGEPEPGAPSPETAFGFPPWTRSGLHAFEVRTGADARIERRGVIVADSADADGDGYPELGSVQGEDRAVIVDDALYYVNGTGVRVAPWGEPGAATGPR